MRFEGSCMALFGGNGTCDVAQCAEIRASSFPLTCVPVQDRRIRLARSPMVKSQRVVYEIVRCNDSRVNPFSDR